MFPFIQAAHHGGAVNLPVTRIVIHATVSPCRRGQARATAAYFQTTTRSASAHYVVDPGEIVQCLSEATIGYHAPPNAHSIGVELCDPQAGDPARWADPEHTAMLTRAADLVRTLTAKHRLPVVRLTPADLLAGKSGICGHVDVTNAWHQTTHVDPGIAFPWDRFLAMVRANTTAPQEDDMPYSVDELKEAAGSGVLGAKIGRTGLTVGVVLDRLYSATNAQGAQITALSAAVQALAAGAADPAGVSKAIDEAMAKWSLQPVKEA